MNDRYRFGTAPEFGEFGKHPTHPRPPLSSGAHLTILTFVAALYDDFQDHGSAAITACRAEKPDVYLRVIASLLPRDVSVKVQQLDDLSDDQLMRKLAVLTEMARPLLAKLPVIDAKGLEVAAPSCIDQECRRLSWPNWMMMAKTSASQRLPGIEVSIRE